LGKIGFIYAEKEIIEIYKGGMRINDKKSEPKNDPSNAEE